MNHIWITEEPKNYKKNFIQSFKLETTRHDSLSEKDQKSKKKKNKYAKFSKADQQQMDPLETMIAESNMENEKIQQKQKAQKKQSINPQRVPIIQEEEYKGERMSFPDTRTIDPYDPTTYGFIELGTIVGAHGVKGEMKLKSSTGFGKERLCHGGKRHLKMPNRRSPREVLLKDGGRLQIDDIYLIGLLGVEDRDAAKKLRGAVLYAKAKDRPENLEDDEYLISDLVGLEVYLDEHYSEESEEDEMEDGMKNERNDLGGSFVGTVSGIVLAEDMCSIPGLGNDFLEITLPRGIGGMPSWKDELVLIPFVPEIVPLVDLNAEEIYIMPPPGLLDLTYVRQENVRIKGFLPPAREN